MKTYIRKPLQRLAPIKSPTISEIYWAAGIYEGEGTVSSKSTINHLSPDLRICISQKDSWILVKLRMLFGGSVRPRPKYDFHVWLISGARARGFAQTIFLLLSPKRKSQFITCGLFKQIP